MSVRAARRRARHARGDRSPRLTPQVFFVRNIGFCQPAAARRISFQESPAFERVHEQSCRRFGYERVDVPAGEVAVRAAMIADTISRLA
ncbi:DEAD/DEAH box helicase family protein [Streptomyces lycii]|uniref:hypothetical protein n=1 Tax=Streptomyces lycii TaxID=2654337 RepID=UPI00159D42E8|nr:hypothetical protein [Streptomyces lycii]